MERELKFSQMARNTQVISTMGVFMGQGLSRGVMGQNSKGNGRIIKYLVREARH